MQEEQAPEPTEETFAAPQRTRARRSAADEVRAARFPMAMRGYDRAAVDTWCQEIGDLVERLEEQPPRDSAVKRALDEVGQETAAILQRAHEAAEEIISRSRSQAEGRLERAERATDDALREAEERAQQLEADIGAMSEQRTRLIEEMRQLADEVLSVADDALDRMQPPTTSDSPAVVVEGDEPDLSAEMAYDDEPTVEVAAESEPDAAGDRDAEAR